MNVSASFLKLKAYCESEGFKGWDPYDGLNSQFFQSIPFIADKRLPRLVWIQLMKRSPLNLRPLFKVRKEYNPKGIGLFLAGYCNLYRAEKDPLYLDKIRSLASKVIGMRTQGYAGSCWGYNFDWQARAFFQPKFTPTVVATTFIANALMDAYDILGDKQYLEVALDSVHFIRKDLNRTYDADGDFAFSYSPQDQTQVFNASLLGSRLLARAYSYRRDTAWLEDARRSVAFCCKHQQRNGAWAYGTLPFHQWIDNFHTGYNLECLAAYEQYTGDISFQAFLKRGTRYYLDTFFTDDGKARYYNNHLYPIDIHNTSQLIVTLSSLGLFNKQRQLIDKVLQWSISHMQDKKGYFYYQFRNRHRSKVPYMRWAQAWMFYAMSLYLLKQNENL